MLSHEFRESKSFAGSWGEKKLEELKKSSNNDDSETNVMKKSVSNIDFSLKDIRKQRSDDKNSFSKHVSDSFYIFN